MDLQCALFRHCAGGGWLVRSQTTLKRTLGCGELCIYDRDPEAVYFIDFYGYKLGCAVAMDEDKLHAQLWLSARLGGDTAIREVEMNSITEPSTAQMEKV